MMVTASTVEPISLNGSAAEAVAAQPDLDGQVARAAHALLAKTYTAQDRAQQAKTHQDWLEAIPARAAIGKKPELSADCAAALTKAASAVAVGL